MPSSPNRICRSRKKFSQAALDFRILNAQCLQYLEVIWAENNFGISNAFCRLEMWKRWHLVRIANQSRRTPKVPRLIILLKTGGFLWRLLRLKNANNPNSLIGLSRAAARWAQLSQATPIAY